jgi:chemotaxis protein methyltransferase CheR
MNELTGDLLDLKDQEIELQLLLETIYLKYDYDFRCYSKPSLLRQVIRILEDSNLNSILDLQRKILKDPVFFEEIIPKFSVNFTEFFRDGAFYKVIKEKICPILRTYPYLNIWHAGCSTGQEVYSLAILFHEEGLLERSQFYGTDINSKSLNIAKAAEYPGSRVKEDDIKYQQSGGIKNLSDYFRSQNGDESILGFLKEKILFEDHNLVCDGVFGEMNLILCRNVMLYFEPLLQQKVFKLFHESLAPCGFLCLGRNENLYVSKVQELFEIFSGPDRIYQRFI